MASIEAEIAFRPAHWNPRCAANIPARWTADVVSPLPRGLRVYSEGTQTREECVADLIAQLRRHGLAGLLRLRPA